MVLSQTFHAQSGALRYLYQRLFARIEGASGLASVSSKRSSGSAAGTVQGLSLNGCSALNIVRWGQVLDTR